MAALLIGVSGMDATVIQPTLTTDPNNPTYYVIKNFRYGTYANYVDASTQLTQVSTLSTNTLWYFVANGNGVSIVPAADPTVKMATTSSATTDGAVWYVAENKINKGYYAISLTTTQNGTGDCWDANAANKIGTWRPAATDYAGTSWVIAEVSADLTNSTFAIEKAEAIARLGALSSLAVYTDDKIEAAHNATDASALNTALAAFNTDINMLCRSNKYLNVGESGGTFETTPSIIQLVSAGGGAFYLKGKTSGKYLGSVATSTAIGSDASPTTAFYFEPWNGYTVAHPTNTGYIDYQYIHNGGAGCVGWSPAEANTQFTISEPYLANVSEINALKAYYITTADRGAWMVPSGATAVTSTTKAGFAPMKADPKQQFAFISHGGNYYLYRVSAKKFVSKSGGYTTLTDIAGDNVTLLTGTNNANYPVVVALQDGAYHAGISNGYDPAVITHYNSLSDGGNQVKILEVADFDPAEAVETFNTTVEVTYEVRDGETLIASEVVVQAKNSAVAVPSSLTTQTFVYDYTPSGTIGTSNCTITVARTVKADVVTSLSGLSNNKAYRLVTERGTFTTDNGELANTAKTNSNYTVYNFAIVNYDNAYYLWSVQDGKFVAGDGTALTNTPTAVTLNALTGPLFKFQCGSNYMNCNANGGSFGTYSATDAGNSVAIIEAADFDPTPVINAINNVASSVVANIKPYFDAAGTGLFQLKASVAQTYNATYTDALTMCSTTTYNELLAVVSNAENFNLPEDGKYYIVKNVSNNKYLNVNVGGRSNGLIKADLDAPLATSIVKARTDGSGYRYLGSQGKELGWTWGSDATNYGPFLEENEGKHVHYKVTVPGQAAFELALGNGEGEYAGYANTGYYQVNGSNEITGGAYTGATAQWTFEEVTTMNVALNAIGSSYYATLCVPFAYTVRDATATAYTLALNGAKTALTMTEVDGTVAAGTPVVLVGSSNSATLTIGSDYAATPLTTTALKGQYLEGDVPAANNYFLGRKDFGSGYEPGFYMYSGGETLDLGANRAYYQADASASSNGFKLVFDDDDVTAVDALIVNGQSSMVNGYYDLQGRKVAQPQKGQLYIHNGKKVLY